MDQMDQVEVFEYGRFPERRPFDAQPFFLERHGVADLYHLVGTFPTGLVSEAAVPAGGPAMFIGWKTPGVAKGLARMLNEMNRRGLIDWSGDLPRFRCGISGPDDLRELAETISGKMEKAAAAST